MQDAGALHPAASKRVDANLIVVCPRFLKRLSIDHQEDESQDSNVNLLWPLFRLTLFQYSSQ